ncbi:MAG: hypothetical protein M3Y09_17170 [Actinomycetota bacterium]|nr:hypothetical protein [Actinomycetota bacterium]
MSAPLPFEDVMGLWQEGERRLRAADPADRRWLDRVVDAVVAELHRRVGGSFLVGELAAYWADVGTEWCFGIATRIAPSHPEAWDMTTVTGAAFARYAREAGDYMVGRRVSGG